MYSLGFADATYNPEATELYQLQKAAAKAGDPTKVACPNNLFADSPPKMVRVVGGTGEIFCAPQKNVKQAFGALGQNELEVELWNGHTWLKGYRFDGGPLLLTPELATQPEPSPSEPSGKTGGVTQVTRKGVKAWFARNWKWLAIGGGVLVVGGIVIKKVL